MNYENRGLPGASGDDWSAAKADFKFGTTEYRSVERCAVRPGRSIVCRAEVGSAGRVRMKP